MPSPQEKKPKDPNKPKRAISWVRLGSLEKPHDWDTALETEMIAGVEHSSNHTATKITSGVVGIATTTALGLYLYKTRHTSKTKNTETEHSESAPDPMEIV